MKSFIERVAHFADVDTRRALGFEPRKVVAPDLNLPLCYTRYYSLSRVFDLQNARLIIREGEILWQFGNRFYLFRRHDGLIHEYNSRVTRYWHPDFNKDGTFKREISLLNHEQPPRTRSPLHRH